MFRTKDVPDARDSHLDPAGSVHFSMLRRITVADIMKRPISRTARLERDRGGATPRAAAYIAKRLDRYAIVRQRLIQLIIL